MIFEQLSHRAHLVIDNGRIARRKRWLVIHDDLPQLLAGIEIINHPVSQRRRVSSENWWGGIKGVGAGKIVIEKMRVGIKKKKMGIAIIERVIALVINLLSGPIPGVDDGGVAKRFNCGWGVERLPLEFENKTGRGRSVAIPGILDVETLWTILGKIEIRK